MEILLFFGLIFIILYVISLVVDGGGGNSTNCECKRKWWVEDNSGPKMNTRTIWKCSKCGRFTDSERH
jgi:hypothetical protein